MIGSGINASEDGGVGGAGAGESSMQRDAKLTSTEIENIKEFYDNEVKNKPA